MTIKVVPLTKINYTIYNGVYKNQTLHIILDNAKLYAKYGLDSSPEDYNLLTNNSFIWNINSLLTLDSINQVMEDIFEYCNILWDMLNPEWDGYQWVGTFENESEADDLIEKIQEFCDTDSEELEQFKIISPKEYGIIFNNLSPKEMRRIVSSKAYLESGVLFEKDPYDFANYAIEFNAITADKYLGAVNDSFQVFLDYVNNIEDVLYTNDKDSTFIVSMYNDAMHFYADVISEPDNISYIELLQYGNSYFGQLISMIEANELFKDSNLVETFSKYIVDGIDMSSYVKRSIEDTDTDTETETENNDESNQDTQNQDNAEYDNLTDNQSSDNTTNQNKDSSMDLFDFV